MQVFTRRERIVLWLMAALVFALSAVRLLHDARVLRSFQRGEIIRTLGGEQTP